MWINAGHSISCKELYREEKLSVRRHGGRKRAIGTRAPILVPLRPNERWSLDFLSDQFTDGRIDAPWVIDGPINGDIFTAYVKEVLAPTLSRGDIVILDNLWSRKGKAAKSAIRAVGARLLFLPACSPDLNPIEQVFAKLKHLMRNASPRTVEDTWRKAGKLLNLFAPAERANYLRNSGYASG